MMTPSRNAALQILRDVFEKPETLERAFHHNVEGFETPDRAFVRHLATTALRRQGQIDAIIDSLTDRKLSGKQQLIRYILRLAIAQLYFMATPAHAAVNGAVEQAPAKMKGMVNAVLRRAERERKNLSKRFSNSRQNLPGWILKGWDKRYGTETVKNILTALMQEPPLDLALKPGLDPQEWAGRLGGDVLPTGGIRLQKAGDVTRLAGYDEGNWWVQDMAATLPAQLLEAPEGADVLDLCAAPGGKTAQSAAAGYKVTAVEMSVARLVRFRENMTRLGLTPEVVTSDVMDYTPPEPFSYILLDAPCSSTGTLRRHPELAWNRGPEDVAALVEVQKKLLLKAVDMLAPGGVLIYCVCSMEEAEGPAQIKALLEERGELKRKEIRVLPAGLEGALLESGDVQTLPCHYPGGMDGFFISRLVKE